jgi:lactate dehydrogenase-like 2-hydroxyacid dehydrogenase
MADNVIEASTKTAPRQFGVWFERALPNAFEGFLAGLAKRVGSASATPDDPLTALSKAEGITASAKIRYDGSLMDGAPGLFVISRTGIGYDNVMVPEATKRGIAVCNAPDGPTVSTAEHAITLLLVVAKRIKKAEQRKRYRYLEAKDHLTWSTRKSGLSSEQQKCRQRMKRSAR